MTKLMKNFAEDFLDSYLKFGLGSMPKGDIDALVMSLIDRYGDGSSPPTAALSHQAASLRLRTSVTRIKRLRYEASLKFHDKVEDQAKGRLLAALAVATLEPEGDKISIVIEDLLAKNWLQGKLKDFKQIYDHSFNSEILKVSASGLFNVLEKLFDTYELTGFRNDFEALLKQSNLKNRKELFKKLMRKFAEGAAEASGSGVITVLKAHLGLP